MSIYHCSIKIISRSDGKSAVASSAYRSGEKLMDDRTGLVHDFTKKRGVVFTEVALPAGMYYGMRWKRQKRNPTHSLRER